MSVSESVPAKKTKTGSRKEQVATEEVAKTDKEEKVIEPTDGCDAFGWDLFQSLCKASPDQNQVVCPPSLVVCLGMLREGARGETAREMMEVMKTDQPGRAMDAVQKCFGGSEGDRLLVANSAWVTDGVLPEYVQTLKERYAAEVHPLTGAEPINLWCKERTEGLIDHVADDVLPPLALVNAVYCKAQWETKFDPQKTDEMDFAGPGGSKTAVPMMRSDEREWRHVCDRESGLEAVDLPYRVPTLRATVILPPRDMGLTEWISSTSAGQLRDLLGAMYDQEGTVYLPRFRAEATAENLTGRLGEMGMVSAFDQEKCDLTGICKDNTCLSDVIHKGVLIVNEEGTEAAAVTACLNECMRSTFEMVVNRPFLFLLRTPDRIVFEAAIHRV